MWMENFTHFHPLVKQLFKNFPGEKPLFVGIKYFLAQTGKTSKQQKHSKHCKETRIKVFSKTNSKQSSKKHEYVKKRKIANRTGISGTAVEGC